FLFFFSSRRRHTRLQGDWSSDVCSSDLLAIGVGGGGFRSHQSQRIAAESATPNPDSQGAAQHGKGNGGHALHRRLLLPTRYQVEQDPGWCGVLQNDGCGYVGLLDGEIVEIIGGGDTENSEQNRVQ